MVDGAGPDTDYQERAMRLTVLVMVTVSPLVMVFSSGHLPFSFTVLSFVVLIVVIKMTFEI